MRKNNYKTTINLFIVLFLFLSISLKQVYAAEMIGKEILYAKGDWEVLLFDYDDNSTACVARIRDLNASNETSRELQLYLKTDLNELAIFYEQAIGGDPTAKKDEDHWAKFHFAIDDSPVWSFDAWRTMNWIVMDMNARSKRDFTKIANQLRRGNKFLHLDEYYNVVSAFSLKGSNASIDHLVRCINKYL